jgi:hypothetical protein
MGLLDEAIREHLELKRRRGVDAGEVSREESEALGPVRRSPDGTPDLSSIPAPPPTAATAPIAGPGQEPAYDDEPDWGDEATAHTPPPIPAQPPPAYEAPASGYVMPPAQPSPAIDDAFDDDVPLPPLEDEPPQPPAREKSRRLPGAGRLRLRRSRNEEPEPAEPTDLGDHDPPTAAYQPPPAAYPPPPPAYEPPPAREPAPADEEPVGEDILEETPEFLEETPDHDRLWFEQRPPRDFDFDK